MARAAISALTISAMLFLTACASDPQGPPPLPAPDLGPAAASPASDDVPVPPEPTPTGDVAAPGSTPAAMDTPPPIDPSSGASAPAPLFYNLPPAVLTSATGLYASPNRSELIVAVSIPIGETVYVMGKNQTGSHLRVVWNTGVGWIPVSFTDYNGRPERMGPLPIFTREPPACAIPITTQFGLNSRWTSEQKQKIAVVVDLFRSRFGAFPRSYLSLKVNDFEVETTKRPIVEQGQFSLKDVVLSLPQDVQPGDQVGYLLDTTSDEPLTFMATIFSVPDPCKWDID